uniref:Uncharacterized protein n=1 Tax=Rangifer tarandus platyrhynchus TaxID=3082113 RepID=A0ACB0E499_RANTA|nr:unnamed protein product [Rangifer tarandus platyrhynchus]
MERKHYAGINPGLQLVEKAGPLAKTGQGARDAAYLSLAAVPCGQRDGHSKKPREGRRRHKGGPPVRQRGSPGRSDRSAEEQAQRAGARRPQAPRAGGFGRRRDLSPRTPGPHPLEGGSAPPHGADPPPRLEPDPDPWHPRPSTQLMPDLKQARDEKSKRCAAGHQPSVLPSGGGVRELPAAGWKPWGEGSSSAGGGWARVPAPPPPRLGRGSVRASPGVRSLTRLRGRGLRGSHCPGHPPPNLPLLPRAGPERPVPPRAAAWLFRGAGRPGARCERPRSPAWERQTRVVEPC